MRTRTVSAFVLSASLALSACSSPDDPQTWIGKLDEPSQVKDAVAQLKRIGDPVAIEPLCRLYEKVPHADVLATIVSFRDKPGFREKAEDCLIKALDFDEENYTNANLAIDTLGDVKSTKAVDGLVKVLDRELPIKSRANLTKVAAVLALTRIGDPRAVEALIRAMERAPEEQDFYVAKQAAAALGEIGDPAAVRPLIRGLFRASTAHKPMWLDARTALVKIGTPAIVPLLDALNRKDPELEALAKKLAFRPGVIEYKVAYVLGDLRAHEAAGALRAILASPEVGDGENHAGAIYALGMIGTDDVVPDLTRALATHKNHKTKVNAAQALLLHGSRKALPALLQSAKSNFVVVEGEKYDDVRMASAMTFARLAGPDGYDQLAPIADAAGPADARDPIWNECLTRLEVARQCQDDAACYGKALADTGAGVESLVRQESAAFHLAHLPGGRSQLPALLDKLSTKSDMIRIAVLYALERLGDKSCADCIKKLAEQIDRDAKKGPSLAELVMEMKCSLARIRNGLTVLAAQ